MARNYHWSASSKIVKSLKGFTLIEILMTVLIFSFIIAAGYGALNAGNQTFLTDLGSLDLQQEARNGMFWLVKEIRQASKVTITPIDADSDNIAFNTPLGSGIQYYRNGTQLIREYPSGTTKVIINDIFHLRFLPSGKLLQIELGVRKTVLSQRSLSFSLVEKVRLRNE